MDPYDSVLSYYHLDMTAPLGSTLRIAIAGAGMAGMATALSLAQKGFELIDIYETASNLGFVGAGIQVAPNLSRVLQSLGVWHNIKDDTVEVKETSIRGTFVSKLLMARDPSLRQLQPRTKSLRMFTSHISKNATACRTVYVL
jgi:2-polyprenyl-6-methoxyphenol hydroxylase-like FAD-dependent oxidoreductase